MGAARIILTILLLLAITPCVAWCQTVVPSVIPSTPVPQETLPASPEILIRTESGELVPLNELLSEDVAAELLARVVEQTKVPRYTIDQIEITGSVTQDEIRLRLEMKVNVLPDDEWITIALPLGDVFVEQFQTVDDGTDKDAILANSDQNERRWHLRGKGLHTLKMDLVGKTRLMAPGVFQLGLSLPASTASPHAVLDFAGPVELQRMPTGAVHRLTREEGTEGVRRAEFWLARDFSLAWTEVLPRVTRKPVIQVSNRMKLDFTTIPVTLTCTQQYQITGSPVSEVRLKLPTGFRLQEVDARNSTGVSVLENFETLSGESPATLIRLTSAIEDSLTLSFELELSDRQFPQDVRVMVPSVTDANVQFGDLDILVPTGLVVQQAGVKDVQRRRVTTETDLSVAATSFRLRSPDSQITLHVEETVAQFAVSPEITLRPAAESMTATVRYQVTVLQGSLLDLAISWPGLSEGEWQILRPTIRLISGKSSLPLSFQPSEGQKDLLLMDFPERQSGEFFVEFQAFADLASVRSGKIRLICPEVQTRQGQPVLITTVDSDEYSTRPISMGTGEPLTAAPLSATFQGAVDLIPTSGEKPSPANSSSWLHDDPEMPLRLELIPQAPSVRAELQVGMEPRQNGIEVQETIRFQIDRRDLTALSLQVPDGLQPIVRIPEQNEPLRAVIEASKWTFRLPEPRRGSLKVLVTYLWSPPNSAEGLSGRIDQLPLILPQMADVQRIEAGSSLLSGIRVADEVKWRPVYSEQFDQAWQSSVADTSIPLRRQAVFSSDLSDSPDILLVRTQVVGNYAWTTTQAVYPGLPRLITIETPEDLPVDSVTLSGVSLTSGNGQRSLIRTESPSDDKTIRWRISTEGMAEPTVPVVLEFRVRDPIPARKQLFLKNAFRRAVIVGEHSATPVIWCFNSQNQLFVGGISGSTYIPLTSRPLDLFVSNSRSRLNAEQQIESILASFQEPVQNVMNDQIREWLSLSGLTDVYLGAVESGSLQLTLLPSSTLMLVSAAACVACFLILVAFQNLSILILLMVLICAGVLSWEIWPQLVALFTPYLAVGVICGIVSYLLQQLMTGRRLRPMGRESVRDYPAVFGYPDLSGTHRTQSPGSSVRTGSQPDFSLGSSPSQPA
jgi:hypothetical protein